MHNHEMYYALVDNDVAGLAAAFDHYAADLYAYCQSQLADPADAADAVHDTFVIAASKITKLSEPDRLRSWLFAVTRNECHSRVQAGISVAAAMTYDSISLAGTSLEVQLRALVWAALARLEPVERELIELNLRHELPPFYQRLGYVETGTAPFPEEIKSKLPCHFLIMSKPLV